MNHEFKIIDMFSKITELLLLNFLFVITSLPLVTLGASLTALFSVNLKLAKDEESYITKSYFHAFRQNFKQATTAFLIFIVMGALLVCNIILALRNTGLLFLITGIFSLIFLIVISVYALYYFPVLARFSFTQAEILRHIPHMIGSNPGLFLLLAALNIPILFLCIYSVYTLLFVLIAALLIGVSVITYVEAGVFRKIFKPYER